MKIKARLVWSVELESSDGSPIPDEVRHDLELAIAGLSERLEAGVATVLEQYPDVKFNFDPEDEES